jgi:hypothetical protein
VWICPVERTGKLYRLRGIPAGETGKDVWVHTQSTVQGSGGTMPALRKGYHPLAVQGAATLFADVQVMDFVP